MIQGRFGNTTGRPYIEGRLILPRLNLSGDISFIADTGADRTTLMPMDGTRLGINYQALANPTTSVGIGGPSRQFKEQAVIAFLEPNTRLCVYNVEILVQERPDPTIAPILAAALGTVPSLLGRDIMKNWRLIHDPQNNNLAADVISVDFDFPLAQVGGGLAPIPGVAPPPAHP